MVYLCAWEHETPHIPSGRSEPWGGERTPPNHQNLPPGAPQGRPRPCTPPRAGAEDGAQDDERELQSALDASKRVLDDILKEVCERLVVREAVGYLSEGGSRAGDAAGEEAIVREAVQKRLEVLDQAFLATCGAYVQALEAAGEAPDLVALVRGVQRCALRLVTELLPAPLRLLEELLGEPSAERRREALRASALADLGGGGDGAPPAAPGAAPGAAPACSCAAVVAAANGVIDDMEGREEVPDRRLLARLCLVREDAWATDQALFSEGAYPPALDRAPSAGGFPTVLPRAQLAFLAAALALPDPEAREQMARAFAADCPDLVPADALGAVPEDDPRMSALRARLRGEEAPAGPPPAAPEVVRPGRFLLTLGALEAEISGALPMFRVEQVARMGALREIAVGVLSDLAEGRLAPGDGAPAVPRGGAGDGDGAGGGSEGGRRGPGGKASRRAGAGRGFGKGSGGATPGEAQFGPPLPDEFFKP